MIKHGFSALIILFMLLFFNTCTQNHFLPMKFDDEHEVNTDQPIIDKGSVTNKWQAGYISPDE